MVLSTQTPLSYYTSGLTIAALALWAARFFSACIPTHHSLCQVLLLGTTHTSSLPGAGTCFPHMQPLTSGILPRYSSRLHTPRLRPTLPLGQGIATC